MTNYFGKQRLTRLLYHYLEQTAPEKFAEFKRELKEAGEYRKYGIRHKKYRGSEWLATGIFFGGVEYAFEIYACGGGAKRVTLREKTIIDEENGEKVTEIFSGYAYYDKNFKPITEIKENFSDLLICNRLQKRSVKGMEQHKIPERPLAVVKNRSGVCPRCGNLVTKRDRNWTCRWCGQAIDWEKGEKGNERG